MAKCGINDITEYFHCCICDQKYATYEAYAEHSQLHERKRLITDIIKCNVICGACFKQNKTVQHIDTIVSTDKYNITLRAVSTSLFGFCLDKLLISNWLCNSCTDILLKTYTWVEHMKEVADVVNRCTETLIEKTDGIQYEHGNVLHLNIDEIFTITNKDIQKYELQSNHDVDCLQSDRDDNEDEVPLIFIKKLNKKYECCYCDNSFSNFNSWKKHFESHTEYLNYKCKHCDKKFIKIDMLIKHRNLKHSDNISYCHICKVLLHKKRRFKHYSIHHENILLSCDFCSKKLINKFSMERHLSLKHIDALNVNCQLCLKEFSSNFHFKTHRCPFKCIDCIDQPCLHQKYLDSFRDQQRYGVKPLKCVDCDFTFTHKHQLIVHANKIHLNHYPHLCDFCGESFASKEILKYHNNSKHHQYLSCEYCNKLFKSPSLLECHVLLCGNIDRPYQCDICKLAFTSQEKTLFHRRKHFSKEFSCQFCTKNYWTKSELNIHKKRVHRNELNATAPKVYNCTMCLLDFCSKKDLINHCSTHSNDSSHICRECNATFKSKINYYGHIRKHKVKKDNECTICHKFYSKYNIGNHMKSHDIKTKGFTLRKIVSVRNFHKTIMCDACGKFFINEKSLFKHRETHKEQEQCPHCKKFVNSVLFERHMKKHTVDNINSKTKKQRKQFSCTKCDYTTFFLDCLEAHQNRHHLQIRPYQCDICKKRFYAKLTLKEHIKIHSGLKPEQCHECGNRFVNKKALKMHVRIHTGEKPYACDLCDEKFLSSSRRQAHRIRKHFEPTVQCPICLKMYYTQSTVRLHIRDCHSGDPKQSNKKKNLCKI